MKFDIAVIGSGPGGYVAAIRAAQLGKKVAIIEKADLGGVCLNWGCIPTKALLKSAQVFDYINHAADYGITVKDHKVDFDGMIKRSRGVADGMSKGIAFLMKKNKIEVIKGSAKLAGKGKISVTGEDGKAEIIEADHTILATGSRSRELPNIKMDGKFVVGYREAMVLPKQPKELIIIGSGAIGMEFAYFYSSIGTKVTIVEFMSRVLPIEDEEVSKAMAMVYKKRGIEILTESSVEAVEIKKDRCKVTVKTKNGEVSLESDIVLSAAGVQTNLENLGLEEMGIKADKGKVVVDSPSIVAIDRTTNKIIAIGKYSKLQHSNHLLMKLVSYLFEEHEKLALLVDGIEHLAVHVFDLPHGLEGVVDPLVVLVQRVEAHRHAAEHDVGRQGLGPGFQRRLQRVAVRAAVGEELDHLDLAGRHAHRRAQGTCDGAD